MGLRVREAMRGWISEVCPPETNNVCLFTLILLFPHYSYGYYYNGIKYPLFLDGGSFASPFCKFPMKFHFVEEQNLSQSDHWSYETYCKFQPGVWALKIMLTISWPSPFQVAAWSHFFFFVVVLFRAELWRRSEKLSHFSFNDVCRMNLSVIFGNTISTTTKKESLMFILLLSKYWNECLKIVIVFWQLLAHYHFVVLLLS